MSEHKMTTSSDQSFVCIDCVHFRIARFSLLSSLSCSLCRLRGLELRYCKPLEHRCRSVDGVSIWTVSMNAREAIVCVHVACLLPFTRTKVLQSIAAEQAPFEEYLYRYCSILPKKWPLTRLMFFFLFVFFNAISQTAPGFINQWEN